MEGQMSIFDFPEFLPDQVKREEHHSFPCDNCVKDAVPERKCNTNPMQEFCKERQTLDDGGKIEVKPADGRCITCAWWDDKKNVCQHLLFDYCKEDIEKHSKGDCDGWKPNTRMYKCCETCKYSNDFEYEGEDIKNPIEEPNIYCTHPDGSLGRYCRWPNKIQKCGVGTWHTWHEYDVCDRWKLDKQWHSECQEL